MSDASAGGELDAADDPIRTALIRAAAEVFAEQGYDRAGVAEIARRAGYTTGAIYGRFRGKGELLLAAIERNSDSEIDSLFAEGAMHGTAAGILTTVGSHLVDDGFDSGQALLLEAFVAARRDPEVAELLRRNVRENAETLGAMIEAGQRSGDIDPDLDLEAVTRFCHALGFGFLLFGAIDASQPPAAQWQALITRMVGALHAPGSVPAGPAADC